MQSLNEELNFEEAAKICIIKIIATTELNGEYCAEHYLFRAGQP